MTAKPLRSTLTVAAIGVALGLPPVACAKPPSNVPGAEPYQSQGYLNDINSGSVVGDSAPLAVPADRRLVVEFVYASVVVPRGNLPYFEIGGVADNHWGQFLIPLTLVYSTATVDVYRGTQMVRVYHDGDGTRGPAVTCANGAVGSTTGTGSCSYSIAGYLIAK